MADLKAADIMNEHPFTLFPDQDIYRAIRAFIDKKLTGAPVVDEQGRLVGILSEKDCLKILSAEAFDGLPEGKVSSYMTPSVETIRPDTSVYEIVDRFLNGPYRRLPVVDGEFHLLGQVTRRDVLIAIESMRDNPYLYGTEDRQLPAEEGAGVDTAMRRARNQ